MNLKDKSKDFWLGRSPEAIHSFIRSYSVDYREQDTYWTLLHGVAMYNEDIEMINALLNSGANVNLRDGDGFAPLHNAAWNNGNPEVITALLNAKAEKDARSITGLTPLHLAAKNNENPDVIIVLLKGGANGKIKDGEEKTPFDYAQENESVKGTDAYWQLKDAQD